MPKWWKIRLFRGMIGDVRRRAPFYWSDWTDAWDYRVVPATIYMYFAKYVLFPSCSYKSEERNSENGADFELVFYLHWLSHWICKLF